MQPCDSMSFHGASYRFGPIRENTSPSRPSSRTSVAVSPSRRRDCRSAVSRKIGAGSRCTSSYTIRPQSRAVEQLQVPVLALPPGRHDLVRGDGDRPDLLALAGVLADLLLGQRGAGQQLALPLPAGDRVGDQDQRGRRRPGPSPPRRPGSCRRRTAAPPRPEPPAQKLSTASLLVARSAQPSSSQLDRVRLAVDVPGQVLGRPADLEQRLLEPAALARVHRDGVGVDAGAQHRRDLLLPERPPPAPPGPGRPAPARAPGRLTSCSRPYRSMVSATSTSRACGTAYRE